MKKSNLILVMICVLVLSVGCQTSKQPNVPPSENNTTTKGSIQNPSQQTNKTPQPAQLDTIESDSEDILDDLANKDWTKAQAKVNEMKTSLNGLIPLLQSAKVSTALIDGVQSSLAELEKQVAKKQVYSSKVQANAITKYIPDIADSYQTPLPTDLGRLDYYGREIALNAENKDWTSAGKNIDQCKAVWAKLKLQLDSKYKSDLDHFDKSVNSLVSDIGKKDVTLTTKDANRLLEEVDSLEKDFSNQKK